MKLASAKMKEPPRAELRAAIIREHEARGIELPPGAADEIVDIAVHAAERAWMTLLETIDLGSSGPVRATALHPAVGILAHNLSALREAAGRAAADMGIETAEFSIPAHAQGAS